jgi:hypothetical protein
MSNDLDKIVERAIPIYDKDCAAGKCEKDCRLSVDYKMRMRAWLAREIMDFAQSHGYAQRIAAQIEKK